MQERLMTVDEVAVMLNISEHTVYIWGLRGDIPVVKLGGAVRYKIKDIEKWIEEKTKHPISRSQEAARDMKRRAGRPRKSAVEDSRINRIIEQTKRGILS
ncbi:MAG: helix-turn-helix domain-containing protein [Nitrospinae bacterium]|nr:helix-turn-helix domain-containing protein [Nitrospinota bacterium]MBI3813342.1 helix-turn-helix domain-containing protein [Nitrospinota bacterium]